MSRHRALLISAGLSVLAAVAVAPQSQAATNVAELGALPDGVIGVCPLACAAVSRTTGYQAKVGPDRALYQAPADGRIVAWSVALGKPGPKQAAFFASRFGGASQATIVVLAADKKLVRRVVAKGPLETLDDYLGQVVRFPLERTLAIKRGQYIGLTVPTWAPVLQLNVGSDTSWRAPRPKALCFEDSVNTMQTALLGSRTSGTFECLYKPARMTYSATFIPSPTAPKAAATTKSSRAR